ncbi:TonB-dependent receptor plug domain-containing protein [Tenacibaculum xiamenense]|uniref:TonB-dependent receptor plug domain-containing protein n=1 Tax=Tenacibaculum xiamenense TaxID=1261553 RepID=UPI0038967FB0
MKQLKYIIAILLLLPSIVIAQQTIRGKLIDENKKPVAGILIKVQNSRNTTVTNLDGLFEIKASSFPVRISIKTEFFINKQVIYKGPGFKEINLKSKIFQIENVEVKANRSKKLEKEFSSSISLESKVIENTLEANPVNILRGQVAGLQMNATAGGVTSGTSIIIRGQKSIAGNNQPLFVIDGIPVSNETSGANANGGQDWGNALKDLNPFDIESIRVLKSALDANKYGSRGLNGVIEITTKGNTMEDGWSFDANIASSIGQTFGKPDLINLNDIDPSDTRSLWLTVASDNYLSHFETANSQTLYVSASNKSENNKLYLSYTGNINKGNYFDNTFDKHSFTVKNRIDFSDNSSINVGAFLTQSLSRNAPTIGAHNFASLGNQFISTPTNILDNSTSNVLENESNWWLYGHKAQKDNLTLRGFVNYDQVLSPSLTLNANLNSTYYQTKTTELAPGFFRDVDDLRREYVLYVDENTHSYFNQAKEQTVEFTASLGLKQHLDFGNLSVDNQITASYFNTKSSIYGNAYLPKSSVPITFIRGFESQIIERYRSPNERVLESTLDVDNANQVGIFGVHASSILSWKNKLFGHLAVKYDRNNYMKSLGQLSNIEQIYPSIGVTYHLIKDLQDFNPVKKGTLSKLSLRANYAEVGNVTGLYHISNPVNNDLELPYPSFRTITRPYYTSSAVFGLQNNYQVGFSVERSWETEFNLDLGLFNDRLNIATTYYLKSTNNHLYELVTPIVNSATPIRQMQVDVENRGWEVFLTSENIVNDNFQWTTQVNFAQNTNRFKGLSGSVQQSRQGQGEVNLRGALTGSFGTMVSNYAYMRDENNNKVFNANMQYLPSGEPTVIGDANPDFLLGLSNQFRYKNFELSVVLDSKIGGDILSGTYGLLYSRGALKNTAFGRNENNGGVLRTETDTYFNPNTNQNEVNYINSHDGIIPDGVFANNTVLHGQDVGGLTFDQAREKVGTDANGVYLLQPLKATDYYAGFTQFSGGKEESVHDNTYIAIREVRLNYNLPDKWAKMFNVNNLNIGFVGRNLGYIYQSLPFNLNPDGSYNNRNGGAFEFGSLLPVRTLGGYLRCSF